MLLLLHALASAKVETLHPPGQAAAFFEAPAGPEPAVEKLSPSSLAKARGSLVQLRHRGVVFGLFLPTAQREGEASPVLVFLHGRGESGGFAVANAQSLPWLLSRGNNASFAASFPFIVVAPQCPQECASENGWRSDVLRGVAELVHDWASSQLTRGPRRDLPEGSAGLCRSQVNTDLRGDPTRVYLTGQSMGGHGAWTFAAQQPRFFAAVAVVCGYAQG